ncbi:MAG TPA: hypothetical protein VIF37_12640 [Methylobacter sp.]
MSTTAWAQEVEQRRSSCRGAEAFPAHHQDLPETPPRATPFDKALPSKVEGLSAGLGGLIPALYIKYISKTQDYVTQKSL